LRRPTFALTSALAAIGLTAGIAGAQQPPSRAPSPEAAAADPIDPSMASKATRYLLRNGMDYLAYHEYDRALNFFRAVESRRNELNEAELAQLKKGIARAQQGKREAVNSPRAAASRRGPSQGRAVDPAGGLALARPTTPEASVQLTSGTIPASAPAPETSAAPTPAPAAGPEPTKPRPAPVVASDGLDLPTLPAAPPAALPDLVAPPSVDPAPARPDPAPAAPAPAPIGLEPIAPADLPTLPTLPGPAPAVDPSTAPAEATVATPPAPDPALPDLPRLAEPAPAPAAEPAPLLAQAPTRPAEAPEPPPAPEASPAPPMAAGAPAGPNVVPGEPSNSLLTPRHRQEVERLAQRGRDPMNSDPGAAGASDPSAAIGPAQGSTRLELPRAPSPTEARPIRRIPVPEEFVTIGDRAWEPNRKYWAAAGSCHMILYFQDPVLERYGQGVEQALGPVGRYFSYPLDDPRQSNQRNQILQPFYSIGKFCFQVGTLPYKLVVDPPWEAEYDLGYYRPGDRIPADTIMITPTGVGPPLKGRKY